MMDDLNGPLLPLEQLLQFLQSERPLRLPIPGDHFDRYQRLKQWLTQHVYKHIGSGSSANTPAAPFFTDHGIDYFNRVILYAGKLAGVPDNPKHFGDYSALHPFEPFLILCAILLHDAGNAYGRSNHEKRPRAILDEIGRLFSQDNVEKRMIAGIAEVHGGKTLDGSRDTIGKKPWADKLELFNCPYRPKLVAAIVRFADEICEDRSRTSAFLEETGAIGDDSLPHHRYAKAISNVAVDRRDKSVSITYDIEASDVILRRGDDRPVQSLVDIILVRLEKMDLERRYCLRFMFEIAPIFKIRANLQINDDDGEPITTSISIEDEGYPTIERNIRDSFFKFNPDWQREALVSRYGS